MGEPTMEQKRMTPRTLADALYSYVNYPASTSRVEERWLVEQAAKWRQTIVNVINGSDEHTQEISEFRLQEIAEIKAKREAEIAALDREAKALRPTPQKQEAT